MPEEKVELRSINWREAFSWTELFRGFRIALDLKKLFLAGAGLMLVFAGLLLLGLAWGTDHSQRIESACPWVIGPGTPAFGPWLKHAGPFDAIREGAAGILRPLEMIWLLGWSIIDGSSANPGKPILGTFYGLTGLIWIALVWCVFGGAITRIAAVQLAREEKIGLVESVKFAVRKLPSYIGAPLFPIIGIAFFVFMCFLGGLVGLIPYVGDFLVGVLWFLPLIAGFLIVIIGIGLVLGWPLMFATISTEGTDSFDAISRSYSYIYQRPWKYAWYWAVSLVYGAIVVMFVVTFVLFMSKAAGFAVGLGMGHPSVKSIHRYTPTGPVMPGVDAIPPRQAQVDATRQAEQQAEDVSQEPIVDDIGLQNDGAGEEAAAGENAETAEKYTFFRPGTFRSELTKGAVREPEHGESVAAVLVGFWVGLLYVLMLAFAYSFFWSISTIIYFLLRKDVDAADMDEVYFEEEEEDEDFDLGLETPPAEEGPEPTPGEEGPAEEETPSEEQPPAEQPPAESDEGGQEGEEPPAEEEEGGEKKPE